jgi:hypothetical protein
VERIEHWIKLEVLDILEVLEVLEKEGRYEETSMFGIHVTVCIADTCADAD